jgi:hypothetical protein
MPRSGTKLLRELLNRHPNIRIPDIETEFLPWLAHRFSRFGDVSDEKNFASFHNEIMRQTYFRYRQERGHTVAAGKWYAACRSFDVAGVFEALVRLEVNAPSGSCCIWGDKSPSYIDDIPLLTTLYPHARVIHIVRDVRDHCLSMQRTWGKDVLRAAQRWVDGLEAACGAGAALNGKYTELRYEDLLDDPERELRRLCAFLDLEFYEPMTLLQRPAENLSQTRHAKHVVSQNQGKYRIEMPRATLMRIEAIAGPTLQRFGYPLLLAPQEAVRLTRLQLRMAQLRDGWNLVMHGRRHRGTLQSLRFYLRYFLTTRS